MYPVEGHSFLQGDLTGVPQTLYLDEKDHRLISGKNVILIDDVVSTGSTLRANQLTEVEEIMQISSRLIVNQASLKTRSARLEQLLAAIARAAGQAALDAVWSAREWYIFPEQLVEGVEPWRVRQVYLFWTDHPDYWEDISCCLEQRIAALMRHVSQVGTEPEKLAERVRQRAREAGEKPGYAAAEAFKRFEF